jgi:hypothetical protein
MHYSTGNLHQRQAPERQHGHRHVLESLFKCADASYISSARVDEEQPEEWVLVLTNTAYYRLRYERVWTSSKSDDRRTCSARVIGCHQMPLSNVSAVKIYLNRPGCLCIFHKGDEAGFSPSSSSSVVVGAAGTSLNMLGCQLQIQSQMQPDEEYHLRAPPNSGLEAKLVAEACDAFSLVRGMEA